MAGATKRGSTYFQVITSNPKAIRPHTTEAAVNASPGGVPFKKKIENGTQIAQPITQAIAITLKHARKVNHNACTTE